jgi:hypothetical protein
MMTAKNERLTVRKTVSHEKETVMKRSYQKSLLHRKEKLPSIAEVTVAELLEQLRKAHLAGCDTVHVELEPETCLKAGLPVPVSIFVTFDVGLFRDDGTRSRKKFN